MNSLIPLATARVFASLITTENIRLSSAKRERSEHTSEASDITQASNVSCSTSYIIQMITETQFPHSMVRTLAQSITNDMRAVSDQIADTTDPIARDELLSQLMLFQGSLSLITLASIQDDRFFLQRTVDLLRAN